MGTRKAKKFLRKAKNKYLGMLYFHYYCKKIQEKSILIESKSGSDLAGNMFYILKEIHEHYHGFQIHLVARESERTKLETMLQKYGFDRVRLVPLNSTGYFKLLATAKYLFNDTSFPGIFTKRDGQIYTNTWHGTPLKMMGKDVANRKYALGNVKRNLMFSDYLVFPNEEMRKKMVGAYGLQNLYEGTILNAGYPRNAIFFDRKNEEATRQELGYTDKKVFVYMPTWRGILTKKENTQQIKHTLEVLQYIDSILSENEIFLVKLHPFVQNELDLSGFKYVRTFPKGYESYQVLNTADVLVTDYSSVFFDFANSGKKIVLYTYDREEYEATRGLYYSLDDLPFPKVNTAEELMKELRRGKEYDDSGFIRDFCTYDNKNAARELLRYVLKKERCDSITEYELERDGKPNVLMYTGSLALNGLTSSLISLLNTADLEKENYIFCFRQKQLQRFPMRIEKLPQDCDVFPIFGGFMYSFSDYFYGFLYYRLGLHNRFVTKKMDKLYTREGIRLFGGARFDKIIHFPGYEKRVIALFQRMQGEKAIFVHSDMVSEIKTRNNQHLTTLREAYRQYDVVAAVTEDIVKPTVKISGRSDNIKVANNTFDYLSVIEKSELEIRFDEKTTSNVSEKVLKIILEKNCPKFITIGRFSPEKGQQRLIDAFEQFFKDNHQDAYLIIIGGHGPLFRELRQHVKTLECRYHVLFIRNISNPFPILKKCDLFILSSFYEALGLVLLEADICGVPCFSTDVRGPRGFMEKYGGALVEDSERGILKGMYDFMDGKITCMDFDAAAYNETAKKEFENLFC